MIQKASNQAVVSPRMKKVGVESTPKENKVAKFKKKYFETKASKKISLTVKDFKKNDGLSTRMCNERLDVV